MSTPTALASSIPHVETSARERQGQWLLIAGGVLLGTIGVFVEEARQHPLMTVWFRCAFGGLALLMWGGATGRLKELRLSGRSWAVAIVSGALMILNWSLFFAAISRTSIGVATVVFHIQPLWVMVFGAWWLREQVSTRQWGAALVALCGLTLATGLLNNLTSLVMPAGVSRYDYLLGLALCAGGSLSYAAVTLIAKTERKVSSFALAWWQCAVGMVALVWVPFAQGWPTSPSAWSWLAGLGIFHTGLAYAVIFAGMARLTAGNIAVLQFVYPATAVLVDWAVYGRVLSPIQLLGVTLMGLSLWVIRTPAQTTGPLAGHRSPR